MTNMADCIARAMDFGEMDRARGEAALEQYQQLVARYSSVMGEAQAQVRAARELKDATAKAKTRRFRKVVKQLQAMRRIRNLIEASPDPAVAIRNLLEFSEGSGFKGESVKSLTEAYEASVNAGIREALERVGLNVIGESRDAALLRDMIRELHGEATGNATAATLSEAVRTQQQRLRRAFNAHGGDIGELSDFGVSHSHDAGLIRQAGYDAWADEVYRLADWHRIPNLATGKPFAVAKGAKPLRGDVDRFLRDVYDGITTRGWDDREPSLTISGKALANQRAEHRVLHFRDGTAWMDYNAKFGGTDHFSAMINGLHGMARDVALMRVLGPNPIAGLEFAIQVARKLAATLGDAKLEEAVQKQGARAKAMLAHANGAANVPEHVGWARFFAGTRAVLTSIQLGSAVLSSFSDFATIAQASWAMGMKANNVLGRSVRLMASQATRETAARMGYVAQTMADAGGGAARFFGQQFGNGIPERMAGFTLRATGLSFITDMRKVAFQMEFAGHLADNAARGFDAIDKPLRDLFRQRGITAADWDLLRDPATRFRDDATGADFISPFYWLEVQTALPRVEAEGLALRLQMAIQEQLEYAVPTAKIEGRALMQGTTAPGTFIGELARSSTAYKSFALSLMLGQYRRFAALPTPMDKVKYAASMSTMLLVMGAVAIQLKELAKGNDPRPMDEGKFWMASLFQGGGLGLFGDFFSAETSRMGGGIGEALAGPVAGALGDAVKPAASNLSRAVAGEDTSLGRDAANLVRRNTPFFSSGWPVRAAYSRIVADNLQRFLDPEADVVFRRQLKQQERDYGTRPWIPRPGSGGDLRAPDFLNALGGN